MAVRKHRHILRCKKTVKTAIKFQKKLCISTCKILKNVLKEDKSGEKWWEVV